jgi:osmotically-inducible protein OsmY
MFSSHSNSCDVEQTVEDRLHDCFVNGVSCEYHDGTLYLRGHSRSYYHKQMAQEAARHAEGVGAVVNEIVVDP